MFSVLVLSVSYFVHGFYFEVLVSFFLFLSLEIDSRCVFFKKKISLVSLFVLVYALLFAIVLERSCAL